VGLLPAKEVSNEELLRERDPHSLAVVRGRANTDAPISIPLSRRKENMHCPPNPKKVAYDRSVREREALRLAQIETCYGKYKPGQEKFVIFSEVEAARDRIHLEQELGL
jgi:hypothetical protein